MQENNDLKNVWELYGLTENPFSISPLLVMGGSIPLESFVGRKEHIQRLSRIIGSKGGSRTFVWGDIGIGKTSFVNVVRKSAYEKGFFTHFKEITTLDKWDAEDFIINTLSAIYSTLKLIKDKPLSNETYQRLGSLFEIGRTTISGGGLSILGVGGNYSIDRRGAEKLPFASLQDFFTELITEINNNTKKETIIHYNNLENISENKIRYLFENLRDFFQTKGVHFVFIGNLTAFSILQSVPKFSSILSDTPFHIEILTFNEVKEIINKRFESLKISNNINLVYPFTNDCLEVIYNLMEGNIRDILNSLSTAIFYATSEAPICLDRNKITRTLKEILEKRYFQKLTPKPKEVLMEILRHDEITNKALSDKLKIPRSNISTYIKNLENEGCVFLRRKNGKDKFWKAEPKVKWYLLKENEQQTLNF